MYDEPPVPVPLPADMWLMTVSATTFTPAAWQVSTMFWKAARSPSRPAIL